MKNYRGIMPVALIVLMAMAIYSLFSSYVKKNNEYNQYLSDARELAEVGIITDAVFKYQSALDLHDSLDIWLEVGRAYVKAGDLSAATSWAERTVQKYPTDKSAYEFLLDLYLQGEKYIDCFELQKQMQSRKVYSQLFDEKMHSIEYHYELGRSKFSVVSSYAGSMCAVFKDGTWGYVDEYGNIMIERQYIDAGAFAYSTYNSKDVLTAPVQDDSGAKYYITWSGDKKFIVKNIANCTFLGAFSENVLVAADNEKYAYYDIDFNKVSSDYSYASTMHEGLAVVQIGDKWNLINSKYELLGETYDGFVIDECHISFRNGRGFGKIENKLYLLDENGNKVSNETYDNAKTFVSDGAAAVEQDGKWGFVDMNGKMAIAPKYEDANSFCAGVAPVKMDGKWGFINSEGTIVIECQFDDAKCFNQWGCAFVKLGEEWVTLKLTKFDY